MWRTVVNVLAFQVGWFACVLGAARGVPWTGPVMVAVLLGPQLWFLPDPRRFARFLAVAGLLGLVLDSTLGALGLYVFHDSAFPAWVCPPWLTALWMMFASTLPLSLGWLTGRPWLAALCGALGGPVSYYAGASLGALELPGQTGTSLLILAAVWGILLPTLLHLKDRMGLTHQHSS